MSAHRTIVIWMVSAAAVLASSRAALAGACCFEDGTCISAPSEFFCAVVGGAYQGDGTTCATAVCTGACCLVEGLCFDLSRETCDNSGGLFLGIGTLCSSSYCGIGACCLPDESCDTLTVFECNGLGGAHLGMSTVCETTECVVRAVSAPLSPMPTLDLTLPAFDDHGGLRALVGVIARLRATVSLAATIENQSRLANGSTSLTMAADLAAANLPGITLLLGGSETVYAPLLEPSDGVPGSGPDFHDFGALVFTERNERRLTAPVDNVAPYMSGGPIMLSIDGIGGIDLSTDTPVLISLGPFVADMLFTLAYQFEQLGGCCMSDETCELLTADACASVGGIFQGDGIPCPRGSCPALCSADIASAAGTGIPDGNVDALDLLALIGSWGCAKRCVGDIAGPAEAPDGVVDALDLLALVAQWGTPAVCR